MENPLRTRGCFGGAMMLGLCLGLVPLSVFSEEASSGYVYDGAVPAESLGMTHVSSALPGQQADPAMQGANAAMTAAVADGVTTGLGLAAGAVEMNPLVVPSPLGVLAMTGLKIGVVKYAETLPEEEKRTTLKASAAVWSGAALNNLLVLAAAPTPLSVVAGIMLGIATWMHMDSQYEEQDRLAALRAQAVSPVALAPPVSSVPLAESAVQNDGGVILTADVGWGMPLGE